MKRRYKFIAMLFLLTIGIVWSGNKPILAQERFIENGDGTVTDRKTGLMWSQTDNNADIYWKEARAWIGNQFAKSINPKYENWRLPTVDELQSLYLDNPDHTGYRAACGHDVKMIPQIKVSCILVWSSDTALGLPVAFNYYLGNPFTVDVNDKAGCRVLAVRKIE
jgi:hypothetical protein